MPKFIIQGGNTLKGNIKVSGFKNAATPILAASILTTEEIILHNVPVIEDVKKMIQILVSLGSKIVWTDSNSLKIDKVSFLDGISGQLKTNKSIEESITDFIEKFRPDAILIPFINDPHADHVESNKIIARSLMKSKVKLNEITMLSYEVWALVPANVYYNIDEFSGNRYIPTHTLLNGQRGQGPNYGEVPYLDHIDLFFLKTLAHI